MIDMHNYIRQLENVKNMEKMNMSKNKRKKSEKKISHLPAFVTLCPGCWSNPRLSPRIVVSHLATVRSDF